MDLEAISVRQCLVELVELQQEIIQVALVPYRERANIAVNREQPSGRFRGTHSGGAHPLIEIMLPIPRANFGEYVTDLFDEARIADEVR